MKELFINPFQPSSIPYIAHTYLCTYLSTNMHTKLESCTNAQVGSVICFLHEKGNTPTQIHQELIALYKEHIMSRKKFLCGALQSNPDMLI